MAGKKDFEDTSEEAGKKAAAKAAKIEVFLVMHCAGEEDFENAGREASEKDIEASKKDFEKTGKANEKDFEKTDEETSEEDFEKACEKVFEETGKEADKKVAAKAAKIGEFRVMHCASEKGFEDIGEKFKLEKVVSEEICHLLHFEEIEPD